MKAMAQAKEKALAARQKGSLVRRLPNRAPGPRFLVWCISYNAPELLLCLWSKVSTNSSEHTSLLAFEEIRDELPHLDYLGSKDASRQVSSQGQPTLGPTSMFGASRGSNTRRPGLAAAQKHGPASKPHHCIGFANLMSPVNSQSHQKTVKCSLPCSLCFSAHSSLQSSTQAPLLNYNNSMETRLSKRQSVSWGDQWRWEHSWMTGQLVSRELLVYSTLRRERLKPT